MKQRRHRKMIAAKTAFKVAMRPKIRDAANPGVFVTYGTAASFDNQADAYEYIVGRRSSVL